MSTADLPVAPRLPVAATTQGTVDDLDLELTNRARQLHPAVLWWWGTRRLGSAVAGARCYLCDGIITTWASTWPATRQAVDAILEHRAAMHGPVTTTGTESGGKSPADAAPPEGTVT